MNVGDKVWSIAPSLESEGYNQFTLELPYLCEVIEVYKFSKYRVACPKLDGTPSEDSNSIAVTSLVYPTKEMAVRIYIELKSKELTDVINDCIEKMKELILYSAQQ